jgi:hypothetical protein
MDPAQLAVLIKQRYGTEVHRTTVMRELHDKVHERRSASRSSRFTRYSPVSQPNHACNAHPSGAKCRLEELGSTR